MKTSVHEKGTYFGADNPADGVTEYHPLEQVPERKCSSNMGQCKFNQIKLFAAGKKSRELVGQSSFATVDKRKMGVNTNASSWIHSIHPMFEQRPEYSCL